MLDSSRLQEKINSARFSVSAAGSLCKITAWFFPSLFVFIGLIFLAEGASELSTSCFLLAVIAAFLGAPIGALGTIANQQKKQTALLAIQAWEIGVLNNEELRGLNLDQHDTTYKYINKSRNKKRTSDFDDDSDEDFYLKE